MSLEGKTLEAFDSPWGNDDVLASLGHFDVGTIIFLRLGTADASCYAGPQPHFSVWLRLRLRR